MPPLILAIATSLAALAGSFWWFGVHRRRKAETLAGIQALAGMKWRECAGLVLQALAEKGYREAPSSGQPGDGGTEFVLLKDGQRCLVGYKHGTAYRLGEANVRDFANAVQLQGAASGILVTLGSAEGFARDLARRYEVELIDGPSLWPQVEPFAPAAMVEAVREKAASETRRGKQWGMTGSLALGLLVYLAAWVAEPAPPATAAAAVTGVPASSAAPAPEPAAATAGPASPADEASRQVAEARRVLEQVESLSDEERANRRATAAARVAVLEEAKSAVWSTQSTLVVNMARPDSMDRGLVNDACAILVEYEELRFSRLQLEPPPGSQSPVRWRQCK
ncbi:restriction endonuclease [Arenimonas fontis]|nr:restriction endonuclease [Arenimonas fontis]